MGVSAAWGAWQGSFAAAQVGKSGDPPFLPTFTVPPLASPPLQAYKSSGRKMLALLPGLGGSSSGSSGSSSPSGSSGSTKSSGTSGSSGSSKNASDLVLTTTVAFGDSVVACKVRGKVQGEP